MITIPDIVAHLYLLYTETNYDHIFQLWANNDDDKNENSY